MKSELEFVVRATDALTNGLTEKTVADLALLITEDADLKIAQRTLFSLCLIDQRPERALFAVTLLSQLGSESTARVLYEKARLTDKINSGQASALANVANAEPKKSSINYAKVRFFSAESDVELVDSLFKRTTESHSRDFYALPPTQQGTTAGDPIDALLPLLSKLVYDIVTADTEPPVLETWMYFHRGTDALNLSRMEAIALVCGAHVVSVRMDNVGATTADHKNLITSITDELGSAFPRLRYRLADGMFQYLNIENSMPNYPWDLPTCPIELSDVLAFSASLQIVALASLREKTKLVDSPFEQIFGSWVPILNGAWRKDHLSNAVDHLTLPRLRSSMRWNIGRLVQDFGLFKEAIIIFDKIPKLEQNSYFNSQYISCLFNLAEYEKILSVASSIKKPSVGVQKIVSESNAALELLSRVRVPASETARVVSGSEIVSILHASQPYQSGGYAMRAHGLLSHANASGLSICGLTRPGFPETSSFPNKESQDNVDNVEYNHVRTEVQRKSGEIQYMLASIDKYTDFLRKRRPALVHLRSTYVSALPGLIAANELGIPTIYEISGMWELVYEGIADARRLGMRNRTIRFENEVCRGTTRILTITDAMKDILLERGFPESKIGLVPNAVDTKRFTPSLPDSELLTQLDWAPHIPVIGYIGTFVSYEGLDVLVDSLEKLKSSGREFRVLLIGDGAAFADIKARIASSVIYDWCFAPGRIAAEQIPSYYSIVDICPFPRLATPATNAVSPLKPFEAMSAGKAVVVSDVPALVEIAGNGSRALVAQSNDANSLSEKLAAYVDSAELRNELGTRGREWVRSERDWERIASLFVKECQSHAAKS